MLDRIGLGRQSTTADIDEDVVLVYSFDQFEGLTNDHPRYGPWEIRLLLAAVNRNFPLAGHHPYPRDSGFSSPSGVKTVFSGVHDLPIPLFVLKKSQGLGFLRAVSVLWARTGVNFEFG